MVHTHQRATRRTVRLRGGLLLALGVALLTCLACATPNSDNAATALAPAGPGTVFPSVQAAAVDALAWSHLQSVRGQSRGRVHGGSIYVVHGGFSYDAPTVAPSEHPNRVRYELAPRDVAHFRMNTRGSNPKSNRLREQFTRRDRETVDERDPAHRPLYILTPRMAVRAYHGSSVGAHDVAHLDPKKSKGSALVYLVRAD